MRIFPRKLLMLSVLTLAIQLSFHTSKAQRSYRTSSVLSSGNWYRVSVSAAGVYKLDLSFLSSLGLPATIPSAQFRVFGNGGSMLPESNAQLPVDDLRENAIMVVDGGDGVLNGSDYVLFFATGPDQWIKDSVNQRFTHKKNLFSDKAYYYITVGGTGRRIAQQGAAPAPSSTVTTFSERYFQELDTVNFLNSGKEWYGEEFSNAPGRSLSRSFVLPLQDVVIGSPATLNSSVVARSINTGSGFTALVSGQPVQQIPVPQVSSGLYDLFAQSAVRSDAFQASSATPTITYVYAPGSFNSQGWLNWFEFFCRRTLNLPQAGQLLFRDWNSVGSTGVQFIVSNTDASAQAWDVTDPSEPLKMNSSFAAGQLRFSADASRLREYVCFSQSFRTPVAEGRVANQDLHNTTEKDYFIITVPSMVAQAQRLAQFHQQRNGLRPIIVTTEQVFHEFSSGIPDPTAIRDFVKMYFDRYRTTWNNSGKYLLLLGKGSFDYRSRVRNNTNLVPAYESVASLDPLATYTSDDFFGFLEDHEDVNSTVVMNLLDIGIGRVPAVSAEEAKSFVDKVMDYHAPAAMGPWRNQLNFVADDEDYDLHLQDAEVLTATVRNTSPVFNLQKVYLDAFRQEGGSAGGRYPQANAMINNNVYNGTLVWNYSGHGGPQRLAEEVVIDASIVSKWNNQYRLPLFITATCDFAPFDYPMTQSLGENLLLRARTGAIALMTTTRVVFAFSNRILNNNYLRFAFERDPQGRYKTLGTAMQVAKNFTYSNAGDVANNRKFTLLGDPAMTLAFPQLKVELTKVNGRDLATGADTLSATEMVTMEGEVRDVNGAVQTGFQGRVYLSLFDKVRNVVTLANDPTSTQVTYQDQSSILFRGKATAQNGRFSIQFRLPRDINFQYGNGKVSLYAEDSTRDGNGASTNVVIGSLLSGGSSDVTGPEIKAYLNDEKFVSGGIVNPTPVLLLKLFDSSGINTGSSGIDHDIVATLDGDNDTYYVLNNFYESDLDQYQRGRVRFQLPEMSPGHHSLKIKAWDVMNNSSEYQLDFTVVENSNLRLEHVLNYPNPFTTQTSFWFEHNRPGTDLYTKVEVFTMTGKLIKSITKTINSPGNRSSEIEWDGRDDYGSKMGRGVYIYRLVVRSSDGRSAEKWERLVIL